MSRALTVLAGAPVLACAWACACACAERTVPVVAPAGVDRVAVVNLSTRGEVAGAAGLLDLAGGALRFSAPGEGTTYLFGYADADLTTRLGALPDAEVLSRSALRAPSGCEQTLPPPRWAARLDVGRGEIAGDGASVPLTADWAVDRCGPREVAARVECGAGPEPCPIRRVEQDRCDFTIELGCTAGTIRVQRTADATCPVTEGCTMASPGVLACTAATCQAPAARCRTDAYKGRDCTIELAIEPAPPAPAIARGRLVAGPYAMPRIGGDGTLGVDTINTGYLQAMARVHRGGAERIAVVVSPFTNGWLCNGDKTRAFVFVDPDTLEPEPPVPASDCVFRLAEDPERPDTFLGLIGGDAPITLVRFDARGAPLASVEIARARAGVSFAGGLVSSRAGIYASAEHFTEDRSTLVRVDPATFTVTASKSIAEVALRDVELTPDGWVSVLNAGGDTVGWFDRDLSGCIGSGTYGLVRDPPLDLGGLDGFAFAYSNDPRMMVIAVGERPAVHLVDDLCTAPEQRGLSCLYSPGSCGYARRLFFSQLAGEPLEVHTWSRRPRKMLVMGTGRSGPALERFTALVGFLDLPSARFVPGTLAVGEGIARDALEDGRGRLHVLLPWAGEIVRLSE